MIEQRRMMGQPLEGPVEMDPVRSGALVVGLSVQDALAQLDVVRAELAAAGVAVGRYDDRVLDWVARWDQGTVATVASLLHRALLAEAPGEGSRRRVHQRVLAAHALPSSSAAPPPLSLARPGES